MSTRTKLERTRYLLDELKYSLKNKWYGDNLGGMKLYQITEMMADESYDGKHDRSQADAIWNSIDELIVNYRGPHSEKINENINSLKTRQ